MSNLIEKKAMTPEEKSKLLKATIVSAVSAAGIGAFVRNMRMKKAREKAQDTEKSKNAIIVPVRKTKFLEGLPTPEELAESRGEIAGAQQPEQLPVPSDVLALPAPEVGHEMTPEEIAAKKKEIMRANSRRFDYFGKAASTKKPQTEKKAVDGILDSIFHPIDSSKRVLSAALDKPVWFTAGALGSIYLAAKISDAINERRKQMAKDRLEDARSEYVGLLEGGEKVASDIRDNTGIMLGGAFLVPLALSALVTNKIIQNRKNDKKKEREASDTYPDEPIILYKTSEAKEIPMTADAALAFMAVNREIMKCAELESRDSEFTKSAQDVDGSMVDLINEQAMRPENNAYLADLVYGAYSKDQTRQERGMNGIVVNYLTSLGFDPKDAEALMAAKDVTSVTPIAAKNPAAIPALLKLNAARQNIGPLKSAVVASPKFRETVASKFGDKDNKEFGTIKGQIIDAEMPNSWVGRTFKKDSMLYRFFKWLSDVFGFTDKKFAEGMNNAFDNYGKAQNGQTAGQNPAVSQSSAATPAAATARPATSQQAAGDARTQAQQKAQSLADVNPELADRIDRAFANYRTIGIWTADDELTARVRDARPQQPAQQPQLSQNQKSYGDKVMKAVGQHGNPLRYVPQGNPQATARQTTPQPQQPTQQNKTTRQELPPEIKDMLTKMIWPKIELPK